MDPNGYGNDLANVINGNVAANLLMGNGGNDVMNGGIGEDILNGGSGADRMDGGADNDIYIVDNAGDVVIERPENSRDEVRTSLARYVLPDEVERLTGTMSSGQTLIGNALNNRIIGRHGDDIINGGVGADLMIGGLGDDTYYVDNSDDRVVEEANGGIDTVKASVSFSLSKRLVTDQAVENLILRGVDDIDATGNGLNNRLVGNAGDNDLHGMVGNDVMTGGGGSDRFFFETMLGSSNVDRITDFNVADDTIMLQYPPFKTGSYGVLEESRFRIGTAPQDADDRVIYDPASGNLFYDSDGTGVAATILFAQISPGLALTHADFIIF